MNIALIAHDKKKELMEAMRSLAYSPNRFPFLNILCMQPAQQVR